MLEYLEKYQRVAGTEWVGAFITAREVLFHSMVVVYAVGRRAPRLLFLPNGSS